MTKDQTGTKQTTGGRKKSITIKDVAKAAGVSTATVSRALSTPEAVTEATREAVVKAAEQTGYQVNHAARNLRTRQSKTIVVLLPNLSNPFFSRILSGIEATASAADMNVLIVDTSDVRHREEIIARYLSSTRADGLIVMDGSVATAQLEAAHPAQTLPPVVFACEWDSTGTFPSVRADNRGGAAMAAAHLMRLGHKTIGFISGPPENVLTAEREEGFMGTLARQGITPHSDWIFCGDFTLASGARAADKFAALETRPTAMFCSSDMMAIGFISRLNALGIETPRDVSVVAFDDIDIAPYYLPALTTIRQPRELIGSSAATLLINTIRSEAELSTRAPIMLPLELIVRDSTRRAP